MSTVQWLFPTKLIAASVDIMRPRGMLGCEGLALWFGREEESVVRVTHLVEVRGKGFYSAPMQLRLSMAALESLIDLGQELNAFLVGQIHSHPGRMLGLSLADTTYGIRRQDYLSLVCPYYALRNTAEVSDCGVHLFDDGKYRSLSTNEVKSRIHFTETQARTLVHEAPE